MLKQCSKCKEYKTLDRFYKNKRTKDGLDGRCADCHEKIRKKYLFSEKGIERRIAWLSQNRKHIQKYNNNYYTEHKEFVLGLSKQWRKLHREHNNKISNRGWRKRRERKLGLKEAELTDKEIDILFNVFGAECANCGAKDRLQMDHHYPLSRGNVLSLGNAVLLCIRCNASKKDRLPEEFYTEERLCEICKKIKLAQEKMNVI